jgi:hypothetical protein
VVLPVYDEDAFPDGTFNLKFRELTPYGRERLKKAAEDLQATERSYKNTFEGQESLLDNHILTMAMGQNHLLLGPPGAAKTAGVQFLLPNIWTKQVNELMTPDKFFGGQTVQGINQRT